MHLHGHVKKDPHKKKLEKSNNIPLPVTVCMHVVHECM